MNLKRAKGLFIYVQKKNLEEVSFVFLLDIITKTWYFIYYKNPTFLVGIGEPHQGNFLLFGLGGMDEVNK